MNNGTYSLPYETLLLLVLYKLSMPRRIRKEMEGFFGIHKSKISTGILCMFHAMHALGVQYLDNPVIFHNRMPYYAERVYQNVDWLKQFGDSLMEHFAKHVVHACFKSSCIVVTNGAMESSFSQLLHQMACLHPCMVWEVETGMIHFSFLTVAS